MAKDSPLVSGLIKQLIQKEASVSEKKADLLCQKFSTLKDFHDADFMGKKFYDGDGVEIRLNEQQRSRLEAQKNNIDTKIGIKENWIFFLVRKFINQHTKNIQSLSLDDLIVNPFLIKALKLTSPKDVIKFSVNHTASISIVTSLGFTMEKILGHSHENARMGKQKEWYDVIKDSRNKKYWVQAKSGPNDVNKDQVKHMSALFDKKETPNDSPKLGILYGKKDMDTISLGHIKKYLNKWENRLLVGKDLWDFISEEKDFHKKIFNTIETVTANLPGNSIDQEMDNAVARITEQFEGKYGTGNDSVEKYLSAVM